MSDRQYGTVYGQPHIGGIRGTHAAYTHHGCRCDDCREANRVLNARDRRHRYAVTRALGRHPDDRAVSASTYRNWGCRCEGCTAAQAEDYRRSDASRRWRERQRAAKGES